VVDVIEVASDEMEAANDEVEEEGGERSKLGIG
jgi:hypothetical protein